mgnify:CR=1 FL=1
MQIFEVGESLETVALVGVPGWRGVEEDRFSGGDMAGFRFSEAC